MGISDLKKKEINSKYIGQTYNYLTILERDENYKKEHNIKGTGSYYKCRCKCGNIKTVRLNMITSGGVKSCGCLKKEQEKKNLARGINFIDLTGRKVNFLTVIKKVGKTKDGDLLWECKCDCGTTKITRGSSLRLGRVVSCGCATMSRGELKIKQILEENNFSFVYNEPYFKDLILPSGGLARYDFILFNEEKQPSFTCCIRQILSNLTHFTISLSQKFATCGSLKAMCPFSPIPIHTISTGYFFKIW